MVATGEIREPQKSYDYNEYIGSRSTVGKGRPEPTGIVRIAPRVNEMVIKILLLCVCHSDLHQVRNGYGIYAMVPVINYQLHPAGGHRYGSRFRLTLR
jgi:hypothetical protein